MENNEMCSAEITSNTSETLDTIYKINVYMWNIATALTWMELPLTADKLSAHR